MFSQGGLIPFLKFMRLNDNIGDGIKTKRNWNWDKEWFSRLRRHFRKGTLAGGYGLENTGCGKKYIRV